MTLEEFQREAARTSAAPFPERERLLVQTLGLCGESGEVADIVKKHAWHGAPLDKAVMVDELGDVLWYLTDLATAIGVSLEDVAAANVAKLRRRYPDGFTVGGGIR